MELSWPKKNCKKHNQETQTMKTEIAKKPLTANLGENFHYMQVIAQNTLEIKKLEIVNETMDLGGKIIFSTILGIVCIALFTVLVVMSIFLLSHLLGSWLLALGIVSINLFFLAVILYLFRSRLSNRFTNSLINIVYTK